MTRRGRAGLLLGPPVIAVTVFAASQASAGGTRAAAPVQRVEVTYAFTGSGVDPTTFAVSDQRMTHVGTHAVGGTLSETISSGSGDHPTAAISMRCERRSEDPCTVRYRLDLTPDRAPVKAEARVGPHATLTARLLPDGVPVRVSAGTQMSFDLP